LTIRLGDPAPDFEAATTDGDISFLAWKAGSWVVFFSHPADFTPVCTTELGRTATLHDEFARRNVKALALSVDSAPRTTTAGPPTSAGSPAPTSTSRSWPTPTGASPRSTT